MYQTYRRSFKKDETLGDPPELQKMAKQPIQLTTMIDPTDGNYRDRKLKWCFVSQKVEDKKQENKRGPEDNNQSVELEVDAENPEAPLLSESHNPDVILQCVSDYDKVVQGISTKEYEQNVTTLDIAKLATYKNAIGCSSRLKYFALTIATILIGIFTEFDQIGLYYYLVIRKTLSHENTLIMFLSLYGCVTFHAVLLVQAFLVGGCCKCFDIDKNWVFDTSKTIPLIRCSTCHLGVAGNKYMRKDPTETDGDERDRLNAQIIIKWWMLVPGFRPLIILLSQGNPDQALKYKSLPMLQIEKNQTYRAFAVMGQLNLVTSTIPCAVIGIMMMDWSNPTGDVAQLVFVGMALCSATLSIITMCFGVIDGLVNTIDTMDRSLNDYRSQQKMMRDSITYAKQHFDDITTFSDDLRLVLARFEELPSFDVGRNTNIVTSHAVSAIAACRASMTSFVCEDKNQLKLVKKLRTYVDAWMEEERVMVLKPKVYWAFKLLEGDLMKWTMQYASQLERALENVDNMTLGDREFSRVQESLEEKQKQWKFVAKRGVLYHHQYDTLEAFKKKMPRKDWLKGPPKIENGKCLCNKPLPSFVADKKYKCDMCQEEKSPDSKLYGCRRCNVDLCESCWGYLDQQKGDDDDMDCDGRRMSEETDVKEEELEPTAPDLSGGDEIEKEEWVGQKEAQDKRRAQSSKRTVMKKKPEDLWNSHE
jgi:hypothetical protein